MNFVIHICIAVSASVHLYLFGASAVPVYMYVSHHQVQVGARKKYSCMAIRRRQSAHAENPKESQKPFIKSSVPQKPRNLAEISNTYERYQRQHRPRPATASTTFCPWPAYRLLKALKKLFRLLTFGALLSGIGGGAGAGPAFKFGIRGVAVMFERRLAVLAAGSRVSELESREGLLSWRLVVVRLSR